MVVTVVSGGNSRTQGAMLPFVVGAAVRVAGWRLEEWGWRWHKEVHLRSPHLASHVHGNAAGEPTQQE